MRAAGECLPASVSDALVVFAGAADDYAVLFDGHLDGTVSGPVLGIDRVVLDGGVQPQAVALLAVVEGALQRTPAATRACAPAAAASPAPAGASGRLVLLSIIFHGLRLLALGLHFGRLQLGGDQRVVLGPEIDFVGVVAREDSIGGLGVADELVLAPELLDVTDGDLELVGNPGVGTALPYPRADLVQVRAQRFTSHGRSGRLAHTGLSRATRRL